MLTLNRNRTREVLKIQRSLVFERMEQRYGGTLMMADIINQSKSLVFFVIQFVLVKLNCKIQTILCK